MFTGRRPRAFQFDCCVGTAILGRVVVGCKMFEERINGTGSRSSEHGQVVLLLHRGPDSLIYTG